MSRHRFEPARLLTGLSLCGAALAYLLDAVGAVELGTAVLAALVSGALVLGACAGVLTYAVRRALSRRRERRPGPGLP